jgi:hypothetical protein
MVKLCVGGSAGMIKQQQFHGTTAVPAMRLVHSSARGYWHLLEAIEFISYCTHNLLLEHHLLRIT